MVFLGIFLFDEALVDNGYGNRWSSAHNLLTGSMSAVITSEGVSTGKFGHTALFYDEYGRVVQTISRYEDGGRIRTASAFDFAGNQTLSREVVSMSDACDTVERIDTYDLCAGSKERQRVFRMAAGLTHPAQSAIRMTMSEGWLESLTALEPMLSTSPWPTTLGAG